MMPVSRSVLSLLLIAGTLLVLSLPFAAQSRSLSTDSLIRLGKDQLNRGMQKGNPDLLRMARTPFERAAQRDTLAPLGHYYAGLASYRLVDYIDNEDAALDEIIDYLKTSTEQ